MEIGEVHWQEDHCDWAPLQRLLPEERDLADWMWMHAVEARDTGALVHHYKHVWTRRYLRLDDRGRVYTEQWPGCVRLLSDGSDVAVLRALAACYDVPDVEEFLPHLIQLRTRGTGGLGDGISAVSPADHP